MVNKALSSRYGHDNCKLLMSSLDRILVLDSKGSTFILISILNQPILTITIIYIQTFQIYYLIETNWRIWRQNIPMRRYGNWICLIHYRVIVSLVYRLVVSCMLINTKYREKDFIIEFAFAVNELNLGIQGRPVGYVFMLCFFEF